MAFLLNEQFVPASGDENEIARLKAQLENGEPEEKQEAAARLSSRGAEQALTECLSNENEVTAHLATVALWPAPVSTCRATGASKC